MSTRIVDERTSGKVRFADLVSGWFTCETLAGVLHKSDREAEEAVAFDHVSGRDTHYMGPGDLVTPVDVTITIHPKGTLS